jgi:hypothetical protein
MDALNEIRKKGSPSRLGYFLMAGVAVLQTAAAMIGAYSSSENVGLFLFCAVPFYVVAAYSMDQARINHALLKEIDGLRALVAPASGADGGSGPNSSLKRTNQSLRD